jgi:BirA family biotin operon repressor/biotin-[acetyl-CoA-carboxylase] ligase
VDLAAREPLPLGRPPAAADPFPHAGLIPLAAGVAVSEALDAFGVRARLKWPNDLVVAEKKIGGLLAEASSAERIESVVLGVGLNLSLDPARCPPSCATSAPPVKGRVGACP